MCTPGHRTCTLHPPRPATDKATRVDRVLEHPSSTDSLPEGEAAPSSATTRAPQRWQGLFARRFQGSSGHEAGRVSGSPKIPRGDTMRLGFDLDGTVADLQSALAREAVQLFPEIDPASLPRSAAPDSDREHTPYARSDEVQVERVSISALTSGQQRDLWKTVR